MITTTRTNHQYQVKVLPRSQQWTFFIHYLKQKLHSKWMNSLYI